MQTQITCINKKAQIPALVAEEIQSELQEEAEYTLKKGKCAL